MGDKLKTIIRQEHAEFVQQTHADMITLYKHIDGVPHKLPLARTGCGLRGLDGFIHRDEWFRIGAERWTECVDIPQDHPLWPPIPAQQFCDWPSLNMLQETEGRWVVLITNTHLPLMGAVDTVIEYCQKWGYTIENIYYQGNDWTATKTVFDDKSSGTTFVIGQ